MTRSEKFCLRKSIQVSIFLVFIIVDQAPELEYLTTSYRLPPSRSQDFELNLLSIVSILPTLVLREFVQLYSQRSPLLAKPSPMTNRPG